MIVVFSTISGNVSKSRSSLTQTCDRPIKAIGLNDDDDDYDGSDLDDDDDSDLEEEDDSDLEEEDDSDLEEEDDEWWDGEEDDDDYYDEDEDDDYDDDSDLEDCLTKKSRRYTIAGNSGLGA